MLNVTDVRKDSVILEWKPSPDDGGVDIMKYFIEKCGTDKMIWSKVAEVDKSIDSYCIQKLQENAQYMFRVIAVNPIGLSEPCESEAVTITRVLEKPSAPRRPLEVSGMSDTSFTLSWQAPENDGGSKILEYNVEIKEMDSQTWIRAGQTDGSTTYLTVNDVAVNKAYEIRINASNEIGVSSYLFSEEAIVAGKQISKLYFQIKFN